MQVTTIGAAFVVFGMAAGSAMAQSQPPRQPNLAFCLQDSSGDRNCGFATMAQCNAVKGAQSDRCVPNPRGTTGLAPSMAPADNVIAPGIGTDRTPSR